jgi:hypothetical protein
MEIATQPLILRGYPVSATVAPLPGWPRYARHDEGGKVWAEFFEP